ncbi:MAG: OB-fold nucleic acid binding domain-containing protein [Candidatus Bathyarchaeota archaeon]|nr:OB-fold nucleic acid binding domain-containing protein [Candidatus Bathyarchaeota archaeon]MDH5494533.1 OB-fold nucleic acid binding domain-containing protein [Candidatus Bathyarchaeota archaeon]
MNVEEIVQYVLSHSHGLTREEVVIAIEKKKAASGGFLTDEAAARLVAAERGVEIQIKKQLPKIYIRQLVSGLNDVTVSGRVLLVTTPRVFPRPDGNGQVAWLLIADRTGTIKVVLWNDKTELARKIQLRQIVKVLHGYVRQGRDGEMELHIGQRGDVQIALSGVKEKNFPSIKDFCEKIANITKVHRKVNVEGVIKTICSASTFQRRDGAQGKVIRIVLEDETGRIPVVFWNEKTEEVAKAKEGMAVLLMNAKVRKNHQNELLELHVEGFTNVEILTPLESSSYIKDLKAGMRIAFIEGTVATKPMLTEVTTRKGENVSVASFELRDDSGKVWVSAWRKHAEKVEKLAEGVKVRLKNVYVQKGFGSRLEITSNASTEIEAEQ